MSGNSAGPNPVRSLGIVANEQKPGALLLGEEMLRWLESRGVPSQLITMGHDSPEGPQWRVKGGVPQSGRLFGDALVVLGGDGTLLATSRLAAPAGQPMLSIHLGGFGFLSECEPGDACDCLQQVLDGGFRVGSRLMLHATVRSPAGDREFIALNDVVIAKGILARLLHMRAYVDGAYVASYAADGLIVSTPTGSTAYSLSAGGPLVHPDVEVLMLTPICSHGLNVRPLVLPAGSCVEVAVENADDSEAIVTVDGQIGVPLQCGETLFVDRAPYPARLILLDRVDFYRKLREKLSWGERC